MGGNYDPSVTEFPADLFVLGRVFNKTTNSYKFVWLLAILCLLRRSGNCALPLGEIMTEMVVIAWHPVCLYHLSLGPQDLLQEAVVGIQEWSNLEPNASSEAIRTFITGYSRAKERLRDFERYVPTRFLRPWFSEQLRGTQDYTVAGPITKWARESQQTCSPTPYWLDDKIIRLSEVWRRFFLKNMAIVQAFAEHHFVRFLQARNPNVPGIVNKLNAPIKRQLSKARKFWQFVRFSLQEAGQGQYFYDIYTKRSLDDNFAIDHFLPWSFVAHDLLWNLIPVDLTTNSRKGNSLPDLEIYVPQLAKLHFAALQVAKQRPNDLQDYIECFKLDAASLLALDEDAFVRKYREVIFPQAQIAINQGFQSNWRFENECSVLR